MKNLLHVLILLGTITNGSAQILTPTKDPNITFFLQKSEGGPEKKPAIIGAMNPNTKRIYWQGGMGYSSAVKTEGSPNGQFLAILSGETRTGMMFPAQGGSQNTLYLVDGKTGAILLKNNPLKNWEEAPWADAIWQDLTLEFSGNTVVVSGDIFSYPKHPDPIPFKKIIELPKKTETKLQETPKTGIEW